MNKKPQQPWLKDLPTKNRLNQTHFKRLEDINKQPEAASAPVKTKADNESLSTVRAVPAPHSRVKQYSQAERPEIRETVGLSYKIQLEELTPQQRDLFQANLLATVEIINRKERPIFNFFNFNLVKNPGNPIFVQYKTITDNLQVPQMTLRRTIYKLRDFGFLKVIDNHRKPKGYQLKEAK